ncbi:hypothetical protein Q1695_005377 [Nippostrongylus brasiliensis]|nr:hypothetical protein Q1695_005377 [Nippostrongylus brasiliensis]
MDDGQTTFARTVDLDDERTLTIEQEYESDVGGVVWDSALLACDYFVRNKDHYKGKKVLELGAGTGVCGLVLAALGSNVEITDLPSRLPLIKKNYELNKDECRGSVEIKALDWATQMAPTEVDVLVLVDCIYYLKGVDPLIRTVLSCNAKEVLCVYERRDIGEPVEAQKYFSEAIVKHYEVIPVSNFYPVGSVCDDILAVNLIKK